MIVFNLACAKDHVFEAWFPSSDAYDEQAAAGKVVCPECGNKKVHKAPMAPNIATGSETAPVSKAQAMKALRKLHDAVTENSDYVGDKFAEVARDIHDGEVEKRNIHGEATFSEARELHEDGVPFAVLPRPPRTDS